MAYRMWLEKEMRMCKLTTSASLSDIIGMISVHLFAKGFASASARKSVLEEGRTDLAQAVLQASAVSGSDPPREVNVSYAATPAPAPASCQYCGEYHAPGKMNCPAAERFCSHCGRRGHFGKVG